AKIPSGVPITVAQRIKIPLPTIAFSNPPPSLFGGGVISVKNCSEIPPIPFVAVVQRIQISQNRPNAIAANDKVIANWLIIFRRCCFFALPAIIAAFSELILGVEIFVVILRTLLFHKYF